MFKALLLQRDCDATKGAVCELEDKRLPAGDLTVDVEHSTLNYKDALAITGRAPVVRLWPMAPGIDFAGTVAASRDARYKEAIASS